MVFRGAWIALVLAALACATTAARPRMGEPMPTCVRWAAESRYRPYGYDHVVHIHNSCDVVAMCSVITDVNPERIQAIVPAQSAVEVVTWVGAPGREFTPSVSCLLHAAH
jgi:hypothetical protein